MKYLTTCLCSLSNHVLFLFLLPQVALADDIGKHVEELLIYLNLTVKVDSSGSLLCVQQVSARMHHS